MRVRWTFDAAQDLERISDYIAGDRPDVARNTALENEVQVLRILHGAQQWPPP
jgi:plasmid stabilization system protein ParE